MHSGDLSMRYFPESPRWLAQKGRSEDAIESLRKIARVNNRTRHFEDALAAQEVDNVFSFIYLFV